MLGKKYLRVCQHNPKNNYNNHKQPGNRLSIIKIRYKKKLQENKQNTPHPTPFHLLDCFSLGMGVRLLRGSWKTPLGE